jgi:hypothetical protein
VQQEILAKHPDAKLHVYVVWFSMLPLDRRGAWDDGVMPDSRVTQLWDSQRVVSAWITTNVDHGEGYTWDRYLLYGPQATWQDVPAPLVGSDGPVYATRKDLQAELLPLLGP